MNIVIKKRLERLETATEASVRYVVSPFLPGEEEGETHILTEDEWEAERCSPERQQ